MSELSIPAPRAPQPIGWSDDRLARRVAGGDRAAFAIIFERHHQGIYRFCRSILHDSEDAQDALQNTMAAALGGLEGERRDIALRPWLYRIAHNESLTLLRRRRQHVELHDHAAGASPSAESDALESERLRQLVADLGGLPERQRAALVMRELSGLSHAEIAAALATSEGAVRQAVYEARTMLHEIADGRLMPCAEVQRLVSLRDGRVLRPRRVRAHLQACDSCREFRAAIGQRRQDFAAIAPPLAAPAALAVLHGVIGGGHAAGVGAGIAATGTATAAGGVATKVAATSIAVKAAVAVAVVGSAGGGIAAVVSHESRSPERPAPVSAPAHGVPGAAGIPPVARRHEAPAPGARRSGAGGTATRADGHGSGHGQATHRTPAGHPVTPSATRKALGLGGGRSATAPGAAHRAAGRPAAKKPHPHPAKRHTPTPHAKPHRPPVGHVAPVAPIRPISPSGQPVDPVTGEPRNGKQPAPPSERH